MRVKNIKKMVEEALESDVYGKNGMRRTWPCKGGEEERREIINFRNCICKGPEATDNLCSSRT